MLVLAFLLVVLLAALATAHLVTVQKGSRQSNYFNLRGDLRHYGQSGVHLALHELTYDVGNGDGMIGAETWTAASDLGRDGAAGTSDEGEADGIPTPGEPNLAPVSVGPAGAGSQLVVWTTDTAWPSVKRIVSTAFDTTAIVGVEVYTLEQLHNVPGTGAIHLDSNVSLDVNGNAFAVGGTDTNPNGTPVPGAPQVAGIATEVGDPPGSNSSDLTDSIPGGREDQITGLGGPPSVNETDSIDFDQVWSWFMAAPKTVVAPANYSSGGGTWGNAATNDYRVTYCNGDLELSGGFKGAGVIIVEGNVTFSGHSEWAGVILVKGDCVITGGGSGVHIYGSLLMGPSASNPDPTLTISGNSTVLFSSQALTNASQLIPPSHTLLYWNEVK